MESKKTSLYQEHTKAKGKIVDFGGWALPVEYSSILAETKICRTACGLFDASHMGEIEVSGSAALSFLQKFTTNDISLIKPGQMQYNLFVDSSAEIIDDLMIYAAEKSYWCVVNASNKDTVWNWLNKNKSADVDLKDTSKDTALIAVQGPKAVDILSMLVPKADKIKYMRFTFTAYKGMKALISRSGYTGEDGYEIYPAWNDAPAWWQALIEAGAVPCGLGSRDILRIEAGYPLYGHEIDRKINPLEAGLGWAIKFTKDFLAKEKLIKIKEQGLTRKRVGFIMKDRALARQGYSVFFNSKKNGIVCSGAFSPNINEFIGMAYVDIDCAAPGTIIDIEIREKLYKAEIAAYPFVKIKTKKERFP